MMHTDYDAYPPGTAVGVRVRGIAGTITGRVNGPLTLYRVRLVDGRTVTRSPAQLIRTDDPDRRVT